MTIAREPTWQDLFSRSAGQNSEDEITSILSQAGNSEIITFSGGFPAPETFPGAALAESFAEVVADPASLQYAPTAGLPGLRDWFSGWIGERDGVRPADDELLITSGGMEGLALLSRCLVDPGDRVLVEGPSFMGAIMALSTAQAEVEAVPMDEDGLRIDALERSLTSGGAPPKFLYVIPDHQNPMGVSLSTERRHALVALARHHGLLLVEDVAYRELGFDGQRLPSLHSLAPDVVAQLGTFSKTFSPGLRIGWIAAPAPIVTALSRAKQYLDQCSGSLGQMLLERYGRSGGFDAGIEAARSFYAVRRDAMVRALAVHLPDEVHSTHPHGGFFSWLTLPESVDAVALRESALAEGFSYVPGAVFYPDGRGTHQLRLAYSKVPEERIGEGVRRLGRLLSTTLHGR